MSNPYLPLDSYADKIFDLVKANIERVTRLGEYDLFELRLIDDQLIITIYDRGYVHVNDLKVSITRVEGRDSNIIHNYIKNHLDQVGKQKHLESIERARVLIDRAILMNCPTVEVEDEELT